MFCKLKNIFNSFKSQLFLIIHALFPSTGSMILLKPRICFYFGVIAIILPCFINVYPLFGGQIIFEHFKGRQVPLDVTGRQNMIEIIRPLAFVNFSVMTQEDDFREESVSEFSSGLIKFFNPTASFTKDMVAQSTNQGTAQSETTANQCYFIGTKDQFYLALFGGGMIGLVIGIILIWLFSKIVHGLKIF